MKGSYTIPCDKANLKKVRRYVDLMMILGRKGDEKARQQVVLATDEACANAIIHGNDSNPLLSIDIDVRVKKKVLKVDVSDVGEFDTPNNPTRKALIHHIKQKKKGGLGLKVMHSIMDDIAYKKDSKGKCHCIMSKRL